MAVAEKVNKQPREQECRREESKQKAELSAQKTEVSSSEQTNMIWLDHFLYWDQLCRIMGFSDPKPVLVPILF